MNQKQIDPVNEAADALRAGDPDTAAQLLEQLLAVAADEPDPGASSDDAPPAEETEDEDKGAVMAATSKLMRLTGKETLGSAVEEIETWRESHIRLAQERAALESTERRELVVKLVKLGVETPHTSGLGEGRVCKRLTDEPIAELRDRVKQLGAVPRGPEIKTPVGGGPAGLTAEQHRYCAEYGIKPEAFASMKTQIGR